MENIIEIIKEKSHNICESFKEKSGIDCWTHLHLVATIADKLADNFGADKEIVLISAYLHDISLPYEIGVKKDHHIYSAEISERILDELHYPFDRTERIKKCVLHHGGGEILQKGTLEEICVADADAISHFYTIPSIFHVAFSIKGLSPDEGNAWVKRKLENDFYKLSPQSKKVYADKYTSIMSALFENIE